MYYDETSGDLDAADFALIVKTMGGVSIILSLLQVFVNCAAVMDLINFEGNYDEEVIKATALGALMLLGVNFLVTMVHMSSTTSLFTIIEERNFLKCHRWYSKIVSLLFMESICTFVFLFHVHNVHYCVIFTNMGITYKLYLLWPLRKFLRHIRNYY